MNVELPDDFNPNDAVMKEEIRKNIAKKFCCNCKAEHAPKKCSQCGVAYYCDQYCQKINWKTHKLICSSLRIMALMISSASDGKEYPF